MKKIYNKFLIVSTITLILCGSFLYFSKDLNSGNIIPVAFGSSLKSSSQDSVSPLVDVNKGDVSSDISFLTTLVSLKKININTDFFTDKYFKVLKNNSVKIEPVKAGRLNPFEPIKPPAPEVTNTIQKIVTDQPSQITKTTAVLNGTVNSSNPTALTYFEYSIDSQGRNPTVIQAKQSLVGTFVKTITGLSPQTTYYYKACMKINSVATCGGLLSFTTTSS